MRFAFAELNTFHRLIKAFFIRRRLRKIFSFAVCAGMIYPILQSLNNELFHCLTECSHAEAWERTLTRIHRLCYLPTFL